MDYLSTGWSSLTRKERGQSERYNELAVRYTETSSRVGTVRRRLLMLATIAEVHPPVTAWEIKNRYRSPELAVLGGAAIELLQQHDEAVVENRSAMHMLREEDNNVYASTIVAIAASSAEEVQPHMLVTPTIQ
jgi:hypothetical protein